MPMHDSDAVRTDHIRTIVANDVDGLIVQGIRHIREVGDRIDVRAGEAVQAYSIEYVLTDSRQRIHNLRYPQSLKYLCGELKAYFRGSFDISDGLVQASNFWRAVADQDNRVYSNYGYYVFRQRKNGRTQYEWVIDTLRQNPQSRRALININQPWHKDFKSLDFPCAIAILFYVYRNRLCCDVYSRSEDVILGLPYDIGFFSFLNELVCAHLNSYRVGQSPLDLGPTAIRCSFTQIYDRTADKADDVIQQSCLKPISKVIMPPIDDPQTTLCDIYRGTQDSTVVRWIYDNA